MKKFLLLAVLATGSLLVQAQTKGTNALGLGLNFQSQKTDNDSQINPYTNEQKGAVFNLAYGYFLKDNERIGINLGFGKYDSNSSGFNSKVYNGSLRYQKYYPLFKKLHAFGGGNIGYSHVNTNNQSGTFFADYLTNSYSLGANGGVAWFLSRRLAFEADLLSANIGYSKTTNKESDPLSGSNWKTTETSFNLSTEGAINNLGFKIYFLF